MDIAAAARLLCTTERDIAAVDDHPAGTVITMTGGVKYLALDGPDGAGNTGIVFLERPANYKSPTPPVYVPAPAGDPGPSPADDVDLGRMSRAQLDAHAATLGIDTTGEPNKQAVIDRILAAGENDQEDPPDA